MFSKKRRLDIVNDYDYDQYTKTNLQAESKELYDKNKQLFSENEWLKENCRRFERTVIQLSDQLYFNNMQKEKLHAENQKLNVEKKQLIVKMNPLKLRLEKIEDKFKKQLDSEKVHKSTKTKLISNMIHLEKCLADKNKEIQRQKVIAEERNEEIKSQKAILDIAEAKDILVEELQAKKKTLERRIQIMMDENDDAVKGLENKNLQLEHDLVERSEEYLEQTISLEAKIDEKEDIIEHLQEAMEEYSRLEDVINVKEKIVENLQKTLDEQFSATEIQNEQNAIYRKEYQDSQSELTRCSLENRNLRQSFEDGGAWVRKKQEEVAEMEAALKKKEDEEAGLAELLKQSESKLKEFERETQEKNGCKLCMEDDISVVFLPCGHLCCCRSCANLPAVKNCPICRVEIGSKIRVFQS